MNTESIRINDVGTLQSLLRNSDFVLHWKIHPAEPATVWLAASAIQLRVDGTSVGDTSFSKSFKQFISNTLGLLEHTPGTTLTADGVMKLSDSFAQSTIEIEVEYSELPAINGSCDYGSSTISTSLFYLTNHLENGG